MRENDIIRAWKDEEYRQSLSEAERILLPQHPAGIVELSDGELMYVTGGTDTGTNSWQLLTYGCCNTVIPCTGGTRNIATIGCCPSEELFMQ
ncbi:MAG: hypothetical protein AUG75_15990 [Cyanobacteria bacterium 13_1_20CM_4_61_6]|nr:MAG: hypothetical protein AUG75_15990 [Cyanobacteria bacterium 13_1_20CM_4_61_6]